MCGICSGVLFWLLAWDKNSYCKDEWLDIQCLLAVWQNLKPKTFVVCFLPLWVSFAILEPK